MNGYIWNKYLPQQYIWDSTCGYHAIKNTINFTSMLNDFYTKNRSNYHSFNDLLSYYNSNDNNNENVLALARDYYLSLNNGIKYASLDNLINVKNNVNKDNKLYFWDVYDDKVKIKSLINNNVNGVFGFIIYHSELLVNHWYGVVIDINNDKKNIHLLDSYGIIYPKKTQFDEILNDLNINVNWLNKYSQTMSYVYKFEQAVYFILYYFIVIYAVLYIINKCNLFKLS